MSSLYPLFIPWAPLIAALFTVLPFWGSGEKKYRVNGWIMLLAFIGSLVLLLQLIQNPEPIHLIVCKLPYKFLPLLEFSIDRLAAVMIFVISGFGTLLYHYSTRYLQQDAGLCRYQTMFALKIAFQLFMVMSTDLLTLFICWQLINWFLCLLAHNFAHSPTAESSFRTFIMLRFGDLAFLTGIVLAYQLYGTLQLTELFELISTDQTSFTLFGTGLELTGTTAIALLIVIGAMSKTAQFPFHMWLPDSLYSPTPVCALLHAGGINAGGFLLYRLAPLYILSSTTLHFVLIIGLITAIFGTCMMLVQNDIKKALGYSTMGQMGYMMMECGLGAFALAIFHLIAHGLFKINIFLSCGKGIQEAREEPKQASIESNIEKPKWFSAFVLSFLIPLFIVVGVHYMLGISFLEHQGLFVLLLFSWVTASQAALTLFRLETTLITKSSMLFVVGLIATAYFFAAEKFTHFMNPDSNIVAGYFEAAELPQSFFLILITLLILSIVVIWFSSLNQQEDESESWFKRLKLNLYLLFMNRLYLDGLSLRLHDSLQRIGRKFDQSVSISIIYFILSLVVALREEKTLAVLAIAFALWLSMKALVQPSVYRLLFYGLFAQYAISLWCFSQSATLNSNLVFYLWSMTLSWGGLLFAWNRISIRFGNLGLKQISGLFQVMPRFSLCMALLIMAALALPPFSPFFAYSGLLLDASTGISIALPVIILVWFAASWYLFKLMQGLLFGPYRKEFSYKDLNAFEIMVFIILITLLFVPSNVLQMGGI